MTKEVMPYSSSRQPLLDFMRIPEPPLAGEAASVDQPKTAGTEASKRSLPAVAATDQELAKHTLPSGGTIRQRVFDFATTADQVISEITRNLDSASVANHAEADSSSPQTETTGERRLLSAALDWFANLGGLFQPKEVPTNCAKPENLCPLGGTGQSNEAITTREENPTGAVQAVFEFAKPIQLSELRLEQQQEVLIDKVEQHNLHGLNLDQYKFRPIQHTLGEALLSDQRAVRVKASTGTGKTPIMVTLALQQRNVAREKGQICQTIVVQNRRTLVKQTADMCAQFSSGPKALTVAAFTGQTPSLTRARTYCDKPDVLVFSQEVLLNDHEQIDFSTVGQVVIDEPQLGQRQDGSHPVVNLIRERYPHIRLIEMSATLASNSDKLKIQRAELGRDGRSIRAPDPEELAALTGQQPQLVVDTVIPVQLNAQQKRAKLLLGGKARWCAQRVQELAAGAKQLFPVPRPESLRIPSYHERDALKRLALQMTDDSVRGQCLELWSRCNKLSGYFEDVTLDGLFSFVHSYCYLFLKRQIQPGLYLPEHEGEMPLDLRGVLSAADRNIVDDPDIAALAKEICANSPYQALFVRDDWRSIRTARQRWRLINEAARPYFDHLNRQKREIKKERGTKDTPTRLRRWEGLNRLNHSLKSSWSDTHAARLFCDRAMTFWARRNFDDSPKINQLTEILNQHSANFRDSSFYVAARTTQQADFLAELLDYRVGAAGLSAIAVHGAIDERVRQEQLNLFTSGKCNLLCTTPSFAGTGTNAPNPLALITYSFPNKSGALWAQLRGRVIGRAADTAYVYALATADTPNDTLELRRHQDACRAHAELNRIDRQVAELIMPEFGG